MKWMWLFAGGGIGAVARFAVAAAVQERAGGSFPWGVLAVNWIGCFAIGALVIAGDEHRWFSPGVREFLVVGILGGFTTFSAFGFDTWELVDAGELGAALGNVLGSVVGGLLAVAAGIGLARNLG